MDVFEDLPEDLEDVEVIYLDGEDEDIDDDYFVSDSQEPEQIEAEVIDVSKLTFHKHGKSVFGSDVSKNQQLVVTGGEDDMAYVWDSASGEVLFECTGHKDSVVEVGFNHDDTYVVTGDMAGLIQVWSLSERKLVWCYEGDDMEWLMWHPVLNVLYCGCQSGFIYIWHIPSELSKILPAPSNVAVTCGKVMPNSKQLLCGYADGEIRLWDITTSSVVWVNRDSSSVNSLDISNDGALAIAAPSAVVIKLTDGKTVRKALSEGKTEIEVAMFDNQLGVIVTGSLTGRLCVWQLGTYALRHEIDIEVPVTLLRRGPEDQVIVGTTEGVIYTCNIKTGALYQALTGHRADILSITTFQDRKRVVTTSDDGTAKIFELEKP
ncbi:angio-associated migratory cell protein [Dendroctonus ponderosae]